MVVVADADMGRRGSSGRTRSERGEGPTFAALNAERMSN